MNKSFFTALAASMASAAFATATLDPNTNILTFGVESGEETYGTALTSSIAGVVKTGVATIGYEASDWMDVVRMLDFVL